MKEIWDSPLYSLADRLEMCAGSVAFEREVAANMRSQRDEARDMIREVVVSIATLQSDPDRSRHYIDAAKALLELWAEGKRVLDDISERQMQDQEQPDPPTPIAWVRVHPDGTYTDEYLPDRMIEQVRKDSGAWVPLFRTLYR